jgi:hypothetical protein
MVYMSILFPLLSIIELNGPTIHDHYFTQHKKKRFPIHIGHPGIIHYSSSPAYPVLWQWFFGPQLHLQQAGTLYWHQVCASLRLLFVN